MISDGILGILCLDMIHDDHSHRAHKTQLTQIFKKKHLLFSMDLGYSENFRITGRRARAPIFNYSEERLARGEFSWVDRLGINE